jgi:hypothetical protein
LNFADDGVLIGRNDGCCHVIISEFCANFSRYDLR